MFSNHILCKLFQQLALQSLLSIDFYSASGGVVGVVFMALSELDGCLCDDDAMAIIKVNTREYSKMRCMIKVHYSRSRVSRPASDVVLSLLSCFFCFSLNRHVLHSIRFNKIIILHVVLPFSVDTERSRMPVYVIIIMFAFEFT